AEEVDQANCFGYTLRKSGETAKAVVTASPADHRVPPGRTAAALRGSENRSPAGDGDARAGDVAAVVGGQQHVGLGQLRGLTGPAERHVVTECGDLLRGH